MGNASPHPDEHPEDIPPIVIPCFTTRQSPFKSLPTATAVCDSPPPLPILDPIPEPIPESIPSPVPSPASSNLHWVYALYDPNILCLILQFLPCVDSLQLASTTHRLYSNFYLYRLFYRQDNWPYTLHRIHNHLEQDPLPPPVDNEDSEHSYDMERLEGMFGQDRDSRVLMGRLDGVMHALHRAGVEYFQGLNFVVGALVGQFEDDRVCVCLVLLLIEGTDNIFNDGRVYAGFMAQLDRHIQDKCPSLYDKISRNELGVEYFAMKWVMDLMASDLPSDLLMLFWDLVLNFGLPALLWFMVAVFWVLEQQLAEEGDGDEINHRIKHEIKGMLGGRGGEMVRLAKVYMSNEMFGEGSEEILGGWEKKRQAESKKEGEIMVKIDGNTTRQQLKQQNLITDYQPKDPAPHMAQAPSEDPLSHLLFTQQELI